MPRAWDKLSADDLKIVSKIIAKYPSEKIGITALISNHCGRKDDTETNMRDLR